MPDGPLEAARDYFLQFRDALRISSFIQFGTAIPLGIFTAAITSRLRFLGVTASGVNIALFGGISAAVFMALSGLLGWVLSQPGIANDLSTMHAVRMLQFGSGGVAHIVMLGLLLAGVSVPSLFGRFLPRWLCWMGLIVAVIAELSVFSMIFPQVSFLLPLARLAAFVWLIIAGFKMVKGKQAG